jgi:hypothetical protein
MVTLGRSVALIKKNVSSLPFFPVYVFFMCVTDLYTCFVIVIRKRRGGSLNIVITCVSTYIPVHAYLTLSITIMCDG